LGLFSSEFLIHDSLADYVRYGEIETIPIIHVLPIVIAKCLFVDVPKQVEQLYRNVGSLQTSFKQAPKIFEPVRVDLPIDLFLSMVDNLMREVLIQAPIGNQLVSIDLRSFANMLFNDGLKSGFLPVLYYSRSYFAAALEHSHHDGLLKRVVLSLTHVHITSFAANHGLIDFDVSTKLSAILPLVREPDAMHHEPSCFLANSERPVNLPARDAVLGICDEPHCREPLIQTQGGVFKDSPGLNRELAFRMVRAALPSLVFLHELNFGIPASRASHAIAPTLPYKVFKAVCGDGVVEDCGLECCGDNWLVHTLSIA
jgi:hypothetical protein